MREVLIRSCFVGRFIVGLVGIVALGMLAPTLAADDANPANVGQPPSRERLAQRLLDHESLYTLSGGLKPISEGFWMARYAAGPTPPLLLDQVRQQLSELPLGPDFATGVYSFSAVVMEQRTATAFLAHRPALSRLIQSKRAFFARLNITPETEPQVVLERIDRGPRADRWRAYGYVFGYPDHAVDFFVTAGESQARDGQFVKRDFIRLPTFAAPGGRFVYAVPLGHVPNEIDQALQRKSQTIYHRYLAWREIYLPDSDSEGGARAVALLRDWVAPPIDEATFRLRFPGQTGEVVRPRPRLGSSLSPTAGVPRSGNF